MDATELQAYRWLEQKVWPPQVSFACVEESPWWGHEECRRWRALKTPCWDRAIVPSSRYHAEMSTPGREDN